ncbi:MAG: helix-turn-helix domain-containing protein [Rhodanobacteraceae bacterium]
MGFATIQPVGPLSQVVETIWDWDFPAQAHRLERILPVPQASLIINLAEDQTRVYDDEPHLPCRTFAGAALDAPHHRRFVIDTREQVAVMGVEFRCGGAAAFFRERMDVIVNEHVDLDALVGARARGLRERLLEARSARQRIAVLQRALIGINADARIPDVVAHAANALKSAPQLQRIAELSRESGLSARTFGMRFQQHVGMSPKRYARLERFRAVVACAHRNESIEWSRVAADCGFYDQPHLVREFREFSGMTPTAYLAQRGPYANHVPLAET